MFIVQAVSISMIITSKFFYIFGNPDLLWDMPPVQWPLPPLVPPALYADVEGHYATNFSFLSMFPTWNVSKSCKGRHEFSKHSQILQREFVKNTEIENTKKLLKYYSESNKILTLKSIWIGTIKIHKAKFIVYKSCSDLSLLV